MNHEKYDTSKVKTITLNGKKYIDMSVIEDIKAEIVKKHLNTLVHVEANDYYNGYCVALEEVLSLIDREIKKSNTLSY